MGFTLSVSREATQWRKFEDSIPASTTKTVDTVPLDDFHHAKFLLTFYSDAQTETKSLELNVIKEGTTLTDTVHAQLGPGLDVTVNAVRVGTDLELQITNNESFTVNVIWIRTLL